MIKKRIMAVSLIVIMVAIILGIVTAVKNTGKEEKLKTIKVNEVTRSVFYAPQYVAINNGYFKENGMEIELTTGQGADAVMTAVLANQCDIGFAGPEASIYVYQEGKEDYAQVFAQMTKKDGSFLVSRKKNRQIQLGRFKR